MNITVQIPTALRRHTEGVKSITCAASNLGELFSVLDEKFPDLKPHIRQRLRGQFPDRNDRRPLRDHAMGKEKITSDDKQENDDRARDDEAQAAFAEAAHPISLRRRFNPDRVGRIGRHLVRSLGDAALP